MKRYMYSVVMLILSVLHLNSLLDKANQSHLTISVSTALPSELFASNGSSGPSGGHFVGGPKPA
jgi:hypothetical protein